MTAGVRLAVQVGRVPSMVVPLDARDEVRFQDLLTALLLIDLHQHTMVMPANMADAYAYARRDAYAWGYDAVRAGHWSTVGAACNMAALMRGVEGSFVAFDDLRDEIALMLADIVRQAGVVAVASAADIERAHQTGQVDGHKRVHQGRRVRRDWVVAQKQIANTAGWAELRAWAAAWPEHIWAIEGGASYGRGLAQFLAELGDRVHEVSPKAAERQWTMRKPGKSDRLDAHAVARLLREEGDTAGCVARRSRGRDAPTLEPPTG